MADHVQYIHFSTDFPTDRRIVKLDRRCGAAGMQDPYEWAAKKGYTL